MKNLRLTEEQLADIQKRAVENGAKVRTNALDGDAAPKGLTQILLKDIQQAGIPEPALEHRFHPVRKWRFDLAWPEAKVALEIEGGVWVQGRHTRGSGFEADLEKYNVAQLMGWMVLRYSTGQIKAGEHLPDLKKAFA